MTTRRRKKLPNRRQKAGTNSRQVGLLDRSPAGATNVLQAQSSGEVNLWQGFDESAKKSSKIVALGAPLFLVISFQ